MLGRPAYWWRQAEICESVVNYPETLVPAGHAVGKSFVDSGLLHWALQTYRNSLVVCTAPSQTQLQEVLWKEVERAYHGSRIPLGGRLLKQPLKIDLGGGWEALAYSTTKPERLSGHHAAYLFGIIDEASGVEDEIKEAFDGLNPWRLLATGNPLRPSGWFYESCRKADGRLKNLIRVSSLESPDIHLWRSPRGLADRGWLEKARLDYGEASIWWLARVLAQFPGSADDAVFPLDWLERCELPRRTTGNPGPRWLAIDLGGGAGGDETVILVRDDFGVLELIHGSHITLEVAAQTAVGLARKYGIPASRTIYDASGLGFDFGYRLEVAGMSGAYPFKGGTKTPIDFANLRTRACWALRKRLDPRRPEPVGGKPPLITDYGDQRIMAQADPALWGWLNPQLPPPDPTKYAEQEPFAIPALEWWPRMKDELHSLRYELVGAKTQLESKEDLVKRLGHSPDFGDALCMSFALEDAA